MATLLCRDPSKLPRLDPPVVATIGSFDGLHLGHQRVLAGLLAEKRERAHGKDAGTAVAISFHPHPAAALGRADAPALLSLRRKLEILGLLGVDLLYLVHFSNSFSRLSAAEFVERVLVNTLHAESLVVGADAAVGHRREGDVALVKQLLAETGRSLVVVPFFEEGGIKIGTRAVREMIVLGRVAAAAQTMGRCFALDGRVVRGDRRGAGLGFPTANLGGIRKILPLQGVYLTRAGLKGEAFDGVTNVGFRPTFGGRRLSVETHLLGYRGPDLYGQRMRLEFRERIRDEQKFADGEALRRQIGEDITAAREFAGRAVY